VNKRSYPFSIVIKNVWGAFPGILTARGARRSEIGVDFYMSAK
jgi:hypothetical protein